MASETHTSNPPISPEDLDALYKRHHALTRARDDLEIELRETFTLIRQGNIRERPWWHCRRCGHDWRGFWHHRPPRGCPRCHSSGWMEDPILPTQARRPSDPPNPRWKVQPGSKPVGTKSMSELPTPGRHPGDPDMAPPPKLSDLMPPETTVTVPPQAVRFAEDEKKDEDAAADESETPGD